MPILGDSALEALRALRQALPDSPYVFPSLRRGDHPTGRPITGEVVYRVVRQTSERCGIDFKPHDARRTVITGIIDNGGSVKDAQAVAGHSDGSTTMKYAQATDAKKLRERLKLGY
jgi:integrase